MQRHRRDPSGFRWLGLAACVRLACNRTPKASPAAAVPAASPPASDVPPAAPPDSIPEIAVAGSADFSTLVDALAKRHGPGESWAGVLFGAGDLVTEPVPAADVLGAVELAVHDVVLPLK